ncbi:MAG TPA: LuxR C-terminal-related transcriptional regulator, partial [Anaerolineaceae bacterium]|nr:LuxR C-terminal-related transcriptional regulator [Anaerolineaceae bacterium]
GDARLAVEYAFKAHDMSRAADLIELHITENWQTVDLDFLFFVRRLPMDVIAERPFLALQSAWVCVVSGQTGGVLPFLEMAERQLANPNRPPDRNDETNGAFAKTLRAYLADLQNEPVQIDDSLGEVYAAIPENSTGMRNSVAVMLGTIHYMEGDFLTAMRYYADALERDKRVEGTNAIPIAVLRIVWALQKQGRLRQAFTLVTENEDYVRQRGNRRFYIVGALNLLWGEILLEWNRLDEAETQIREGLRLMEDWPIPQMFCLGYCIFARLLLAQGDADSARITLAKAEDLHQSHTFHPEFTNHLEQAQTLLWSAEKNLPALETFVREWDTRDRSDLRFRYEAHWIELSRALLALGRYEDAAEILERLSASTGERQGSRITILTLLTVVFHDRPALAESALEEALGLAMPEGYLRTFVEAGERLRETLNAWVQHRLKRSDDPLRAYAQQILLAFGTSPEPSLEDHAAQNLPEPLSQREREVLQFVAEGLTNQQIADRLVISIRTVKKHIENILGKLAVKNRIQAVARGRELGLLDP